MKQQLAEYLKLMSAIGVWPGLKAGFTKSKASEAFAIQLPGVAQKTFVRKGTSDWNAFKQGQWLPNIKMMFLELHDNVHRDCSKNVFKAVLEHDFSVDITGENIVLFNNRYRP